MSTVGIILAGGRSRRFGSPKGLVEIGGEPIVARLLRIFGSELGATALVTDEPELYAHLEVSSIPDVTPRMGPLSGIQAGLGWARRAGAEGIFCAPCDAPFLQGELIRRLLPSSDRTQAVVPESRGPLGFEPLFGWYSVALLGQVDRAVAEKRLALRDFVTSIPSVEYLPLAEVVAIMDPDKLFFNLNVPEDLQTARRLAEENIGSES